MKRITTTLFLVISFGLISFLIPYTTNAQSANLSLSPSSGSYTVGGSFVVKVLVNSGGSSINAAEASLKYDQNTLSITNITKDGSPFVLWTVEPTFSNSSGTINFGGGSTSPFSKTSTLINISFRALKTGNANVSFVSGSVLAADGKGTDILSNMSPANFTIKEGQAPPPSPPPPPPTPQQEPPSSTSGAGTPNTPKINSSTHPDSEKWYANNSPAFSWDIPAGVSGVRLLLNQSVNSIPTITYTPPIRSRNLSDLSDGEWYFHVRFQNQSGWGATAHRKILIDTKEPSTFNIEYTGLNPSTYQPQFTLTANDDTSGISRFELVFDGGVPEIAEIGNLSDGTFAASRLPPGDHAVQAKAFDGAGNFIEASAEFTVEAYSLEDAVLSEEESKEKSTGTGKLIFFLILEAAILSGGFVYEIYRRDKIYKQEALAVRTETKEVREKTGKIFSALRGEFEEQIEKLDEKPKLSKSEKDVYDKLKEALDISEEFINKELEDIDKMTKVKR